MLHNLVGRKVSVKLDNRMFNQGVIVMSVRGYVFFQIYVLFMCCNCAFVTIAQMFSATGVRVCHVTIRQKSKNVCTP